MRRLRWAWLALPALLGGVGVWTAGTESGRAAGALSRPFEEQLRYVGRDYVTGGPVTVDDRFILQVERSVEQYGKEEIPAAVPPPPVEGADVALIRIPRLGVEADVDRFGLDKFGRLEVPQDNRTVGWNPAFTWLPGSDETTFLAAHYMYAGAPGVFFRLATLLAGDEVEVALSDGSVHRYRVTATLDYELGVIDMGALLAGREGAESLTLMTCSGPKTDGEYPWRTVVLAERITT